MGIMGRRMRRTRKVRLNAGGTVKRERVRVLELVLEEWWLCSSSGLLGLGSGGGGFDRGLGGGGERAGGRRNERGLEEDMGGDQLDRELGRGEPEKG